MGHKNCEKYGMKKGSDRDPVIHTGSEEFLSFEMLFISQTAVGNVLSLLHITYRRLKINLQALKIHRLGYRIFFLNNFQNQISRHMRKKMFQTK